MDTGMVHALPSNYVGKMPATDYPKLVTTDSPLFDSGGIRRGDSSDSSVFRSEHAGTGQESRARMVDPRS